MNRALHHAILLSLALHGLILFAVSMEHPPVLREAAPEPLAARLVEPPPPPPALPVSPPLSPQPAPPPASPPPIAKPKPSPAPKPKAAAKPKTAANPKVPATAAPPVAAAPSTPVPEALPTKPAAPAAPAVTRVDPTPAPAPGVEQLETRTREQYRLQLLAAARRHNRYPRLARENNWEGEVQVSVTVGADGSASLRIKDSSGHPVLDRQAMEMFKRAQAAVPLPAALRGKEFSLDLKARYSLKDQVSG